MSDAMAKPGPHQLIVSYGQRNFPEIWRFVVVGTVAFAIYSLSFSLLYETLHAHYRLALSLAYALTVCCHFFLHKLFTFDARANRIRTSAPRYGMLLAVNYLLTLALSGIVVDLCGGSPYLALFVTTGGTSLSSFLSMKYFVFRSAPAW